MLRRISRALDFVYRAAGVGAGALLVLLCGVIIYNVAARLLNPFLTGADAALPTLGVSDVAGYVMATSTFMALAYTFRSNGHIRVALIIQNLTGRTRRAVETLVLAIMAAAMCFFAYYMIKLAHVSYVWQERSEGADAMLLWIPQTPVAVGASLFALSVVHSLVQALFDYESVNPETAKGEGVNEV